VLVLVTSGEARLGQFRSG